MSTETNQNESKKEESVSSLRKYKSFFDGTKQLSDNYKDNDLKIINNLRKFKKLNKEEEGYEELFPTEDQQKFGGISSLISFIYPPKIRGYQNRIGFRYYKENPLTENNNVSYFTLIYVGERKFQILEKQTNIVDNNGKTFFKESLDCLDIILNIIKNKLGQDKDNLTYPSSACEILGFIFAAKYSKKKLSNIEILDPYYPNPLIQKSMEECEHKIDESKIFLEPILFNDHATVLLFYYKKRRENVYIRKNIIFDMSSAHYKILSNQDPIFFEEMGYNLEKFPKKAIQIGRSCSIWFYSSMLYLLENKISFPLKTNDLYLIIQKIYELFNISEDINTSKISNRENENISVDKFISYKMAFKTFINIQEVLEEFGISTNLSSDNFGKYQKIFYELRTNINLIELNYDYYYKLFKQEIMNSSAIRKMRTLINNAEDYFGCIVNAKKNIYNYKKNPLTYKDIKGENNDIDRFNKDIDINMESFNKSLKSIKITLYSKEKFHKIFIDSSDTFLSILEN